MSKYIRSELTVVEFEDDDIVATSVPEDEEIIQRDSPVYNSNGSRDENWLPWLE